jgi:DNA polymerase V
MRQHIIALVDCDCFFVSCERKDNPALAGKPVCVMTGGGNKRIIVSRSKEAKALGIKMGVPYFQIKDVYKEAICLPARMHRYAEIST